MSSGPGPRKTEVVFAPSTEPHAAFLLSFDRETLALVVFRQYHSANAAIPAFFREEDEGKLATVVEAESEATLLATRDLAEIAQELRQSWERAEAQHKRLKEIVADLPYPERRVFELCNNVEGQSLTEVEAAAEIGCSVRTVRRLRQRGGAKVMIRFEEERRPNAD